MSAREITPDRWREELDSFSRSHEGWLVRVTVKEAGGPPRVAAQNLPLQGIVADADTAPAIVVLVGDTTSNFAHEVKNPTGVVFEQTDAGVTSAMKVCAGDGSTTTVEFQSPMRPEEVDGIP